MFYLINHNRVPVGPTGDTQFMTEKLLHDQISDQVEEIFGDLKEPSRGAWPFTDQANCDYCADTRQLLQEVTGLSDKLNLTVYDIVEHSDLAARYKVDKTPGFVLAGKDGDAIIDYGIRYFGIPAGHEFTTLIHDLLAVSGGDFGLRRADARLSSKGF